jgi:diguanylate cyclase (GGDEF)-like protein
MFDHQIIIVRHPDSDPTPYERALAKFSRLKIATSAVDALQFLEDSPAHVAIVETQCADMSGIEIAEAIRDIDEDANHFTYICLVGDEIEEALTQAAVETVDLHIKQADTTLTAITLAGQRIAGRINALGALNVELREKNFELQKGQLLDPLTGLGNMRMAEQSLDDSIRQIESRGGAVCVLILAVTNLNDVIAQYDQRIGDELIQAVAEKIKHLVRPLDIVTYIEDGRFAMILLQPSIEHCTAECYQRIYDGVRLKTFKTAAGFVSADIAMSICASHAENGPPAPETLLNGAATGLFEAVRNSKVVVNHLTPAA